MAESVWRKNMKNKEYRTCWTKGKKGSDDAFFIRTRVFIIEQGYTMEFDDLDEASWHLTVYDGEEPIAAARTFPNEDGSWQIGRVCVLEEYRGKRIGELVVKTVEEKLCSLNVPEARLSAQTRAKGFYRKLGYAESGPEYADEGCPHIGMSKALK